MLKGCSSVLLVAGLGFVSLVCGQDRVVDTASCVDGAASVWDTWEMWTMRGACSANCDGETGEQSRMRNRTCPVSIEGCDAEQVQTQIFSCEGSGGPVDGMLGQWSQWADSRDCNVICGRGRITQVRTRQCDSPAPDCGGRDCPSGRRRIQARFPRCNAGSCGAACRRSSPPVVLTTQLTEGFYQLCARGSIREIPCPTTFRAYFVFGIFNAQRIFNLCG